MPKPSTVEIMSRPTKIALAVVFAIVVALFALTMYEIYVPGQTTEVIGTVVGIQQIANKSLIIRRYVGTKLENGFTVRARVDYYVTLVPGDRSIFLEINTPLFGFKRYHFHR